MNNFIISVEGIDGSGKTSLISRIEREIPGILVFREPGGTYLSELCKDILKGNAFKSQEVSFSIETKDLLEDLLAISHNKKLKKTIENILNKEEIYPMQTKLTAAEELSLFNIARSELITSKIIPVLESDNTSPIIFDRFTDSTIAYQSYGRGLNLNSTIDACKKAAKGVVPDKTILLRIDPEERLHRIRIRGKEDNIESSGEIFFRKIVSGFDQMSEENPERFFIVDGSQSKEYIAQEVITAIKLWLGKK